MLFNRLNGKSRLILLIFLSLLFLPGCDDDHKVSNQFHFEKNTKNDMNYSINEWINYNLVVLSEEGPNNVYYLLNVSDIYDFARFVENNTIPESAGLGPLQTQGGGIVVYVLHKNGYPNYYIPISFQYVKGLGDKTSGYKWELLKRQDEKRESMREMLQTKSKQISEDQAQNYIKGFATITHYKPGRYWKKD